MESRPRSAGGAQVAAIAASGRVPGIERESWAGRTAVIDDERMKRFGEFVEEARATARVPGVAVAVVHGGKIVFERGYGVLELGWPGSSIRARSDGIRR